MLFVKNLARKKFLQRNARACREDYERKRTASKRIYKSKKKEMLKNKIKQQSENHNAEI